MCLLTNESGWYVWSIFASVCNNYMSINELVENNDNLKIIKDDDGDLASLFT